MHDDERTIEEEGEADGQEIQQPFDPNKIRVNLWTPTIDLLLKRMKEGEIDLAPDFQREAGLWKPRNMSRLVESLLIRIPLPAFYLDAVSDDKMAVIDGIQRLTVLRRFVAGELPLTGLEFLTDLEGAVFSGLPRPLQRRIEETMVTVYVVEKGTPDAAKLNIFKRINTGGLALSAQEIRHAMNPGPVRTFLKELAGGSAFQRATGGGVHPRRMDDRECVVRFLSFYLTPYTEYKPGDFDAFLNDGMKRVNQMSASSRGELRDAFELGMSRAVELFGKDAFRKRYKKEDPRNPVNKALFESWSVGLARLDGPRFEALRAARDSVQSAFIRAMNAPGRPDHPSLSDSVSFGTGNEKKVFVRFDAVEAIIAESLGSEP